MIDHLVVIAGPSNCGKTRLMKLMLENRLVEINSLLGIDNFRDMQFSSGKSFRKLTETKKKNINPKDTGIPVKYDI